jgi:hypothetical protein
VGGGTETERQWLMGRLWGMKRLRSCGMERERDRERERERERETVVRQRRWRQPWAVETTVAHHAVLQRHEPILQRGRSHGLTRQLQVRWTLRGRQSTQRGSHTDTLRGDHTCRGVQTQTQAHEAQRQERAAAV